MQPTAGQEAVIAAGCDLSTRALDLCILDTDTGRAEHRRIALTGRWWHDAGHMWQHLGHIDPADDMDAIEWLRHHRVDLLGIERPYGPHRQAIAALHTILGALLSALATDASWLPTLEIRPAEMRRHLGLKGNAAKEEMHREITSRVRAVEHWPPDALDACAVAHAAWQMCERAATDQKETP